MAYFDYTNNGLSLSSVKELKIGDKFIVQEKRSDGTPLVWITPIEIEIENINPLHVYLSEFQLKYIYVQRSLFY